MSPIPDAPVLVAGVGVSGRAAALALAARGLVVYAIDERDGAAERAAAAELAAAGVEVSLGTLARLPPGIRLVVTSPGWRPEHQVLLAAAAAGAEVIGEVELAWRLRPPGAAAWLGVTGTNGKTTTTRMAAEMLTAAGLRAVAAGNVGLAAVSAVLAEPAPEILVVELSSFQLHWSKGIACRAAVVLNLAEDHLDWHGSFAAYAAAKTKIWAGEVSVGNLDDPRVRSALDRAAGRRVGFTLAAPGPGELGRRGSQLIDRAFSREPDGAVLAAVSDVHPSGSHQLANALAAAALARSVGASPAAVAAGLAAYRPEPHRGDLVGSVAGVDYVDDSKATNPHAALASLKAYRRVVWVVGGLLKGADLSPAVVGARDRLVAAVVIGTQRGPVLETLARHAPRLPVVEVSATETGAMSEVVAAAARLASPGDTVLLAPAAASMDMFRNYAERGEAFAAAVRELT
ncbi:MAG: UDP-N-acetylmuramoyl-L-alanine--D-glutamate ligase [Mycobacteriales bacterium]